MTDSTPPLPEVFVEQIRDDPDWTDDEGNPRGPRRVRVYKPVQHASGKWGCTVESQWVRASEPPRRTEFADEESSIQALFDALKLAGNMVGRRYVPTPPDIFVERILDYADGDAIRPVTVRIYKPVQRGPEEWGCISEIQGLEQPLIHEHIGADSVQALFHALRIVGVELDHYKGELSWHRRYKPWELVALLDASEMML
jgi:hypothetical protein